MKITLGTPDGVEHIMESPHSGCEYVQPTDEWACECGEADVMGNMATERSPFPDRYLIADAHCFRCKAKVGELVVAFNTIFGRGEDERVLNGRPRVY